MHEDFISEYVIDVKGRLFEKFKHEYVHNEIEKFLRDKNTQIENFEIIEPKFVNQQVMNALEIPSKGEVVFKNELTLAARTLTFANFKSPIVSIVKANNCLYLHMQEGTYEVLTSLINLPHQGETNDE